MSSTENYIKQLQGLILQTPVETASEAEIKPTETKTFDDYVKHLENLMKKPSDSENTIVAATGTALSATVASAPVVAAPLVPNTNMQSLINASVGIKEMQQQQPSASYDGRKLNFMLVSTHLHQVTGYSKVSYNIINQLVKNPWLNITHYGFQRLPSRTDYEGRTYPPSVKVYDAITLEKPSKQGFGYAELPAAIEQTKPDVVMIYNDMAVIHNFLESIKKSGIKRTFQVWLYVDQVYNCQLAGYIDLINREADRVFAFTSYWRDCLKEQGVHRPIDIIHHGFDEKMFYKMPKTMARKKLNLPEDVFTFMTVNRNQPRKRHDLLIMAFVELIVKYPNRAIALLCVCDKGEKGGWWLFEIFARELKRRNVPVERFGNRLMITQRDMDFKDDEINTFYNAADVCISTADGEGWGLCTFESMGVGTPQIVPDVGGHKEFCNADNALVVKPKFRYYLPMVFCPVGGEAEACDPHDICLAMETYVNDSELMAKHGAAAASTVKKYTWESAVKQLTRRLKQQHEDILDNN